MNYSYVGFSTKLIDNWEQYCDDPQPRKGTKDPVKQAAQVEDKLRERRANASLRPFAALVDRVYVIDSDGRYDAAGHEALRLLFKQRMPVALNFAELHTLAYLTAIRYNADELASEGLRIPVAWWPNNLDLLSTDGISDPYKVLVPSSLRNEVRLVHACEYLNISQDLRHPAGPEGRAELARAMWRAMGRDTP